MSWSTALCLPKVRSLPAEHLPPLDASRFQTQTQWEDTSISPLQAMERETIVQALKQAFGSKQDAAQLLKIHRSKLWRKMKAYNLNFAIGSAIELS
jgi:transcriptional regulator with PAS, ATPase and Fis domain